MTRYCPALDAGNFYFESDFDERPIQFAGPDAAGTGAIRAAISAACSVILAACIALGSALPAHAQDGSVSPGWSESGRASFYSKFWHGRRTASGDRFDNNELTAAHPWLPFGTRVKVLVEETGQEVVVTITDRMFSRRRVIDLSQRAARLLGIIRQGTAEVRLVTE